MDAFEARLPGAVAHLVAARSHYARDARRSVLARTWPVICEQLFGHYDAVRGSGRARVASAA